MLIDGWVFPHGVILFARCFKAFHTSAKLLSEVSEISVHDLLTKGHRMTLKIHVKIPIQYSINESLFVGFEKYK